MDFGYSNSYWDKDGIERDKHTHEPIPDATPENTLHLSCIGEDGVERFIENGMPVSRGVVTIGGVAGRAGRIMSSDEVGKRMLTLLKEKLSPVINAINKSGSELPPCD